jgi:hypothetical protein
MSLRVLITHQQSVMICSFIGAFTKLQNANTSFIMSVCPNETTQLPLDGFSLQLTFENFWKIRWGNSSSIKIWQEQLVLYMKINIHFWSHLAQFFLQWEMFQIEVAEKIKTHMLCSVMVLENCAIYEIIWKNIVQPGRPQVTIWCGHIMYWIPKAINTHSKYLILFFPCSNGCTNASVCYITCTLPVLLLQNLIPFKSKFQAKTRKRNT